MSLKRVRIEHLRCLEAVELELDAGRNYVFGANGAGKTSLLEAIHLLGRGRSFRTRQARRLIRRGGAGFAVYGVLTADQGGHRMGVGFGANRLQMRIDGRPAGGTAELAAILPVYVLDPGLHQLVEGGPSVRRRFLDWGVFHVEQSYLESWKRYRRLLGQRNAALKRYGAADVGAWTVGLAEAGTLIHEARGRYVRRLAAATAMLGERLLGAPVELDYAVGWDESRSLGAALAANERRDRAAGTTQLGPHRADLRIVLGARGVREEVSRGQQKLVAAALILGQVSVFAEQSRRRSVLLVDDPAAELDEQALGRLLEALEELPAQLLLTGLSAEHLPPAAGFPVFHVERGHLASVL